MAVFGSRPRAGPGPRQGQARAHAHLRAVQRQDQPGEHHRRQLANARSKRHYQTVDGRRNKKLLNGKRSKSVNEAENTSPGDVDAPLSPAGQPTLKDPSDASSVSSCSCEESTSESVPQETLKSTAPCENVALPLEGLLLDKPTLVNSRILPYAQMVASVIEGRPIRREELCHVLRRSMRQRSFDRLPRREYILRVLNQHPP